MSDETRRGGNTDSEKKETSERKRYGTMSEKYDTSGKKKEK